MGPQKANKPQSSHFHLPVQFLLGVVFMISGALLLLKQFNIDYLPFVPIEVFVYVCGFGSFLGGIYLIIMKIYRPRIYLH